METARTITQSPAVIPASHQQNKKDAGAKEDTIKMRPPVFFQPKLTVGAPDDPLEKEADDMADKVMRMPMPGLISFSSGKNIVNRKCAACEEEEKIHRKESSSDSTSAAPSIVHDVLSAGGRSMDSETRSFMEPRFNYDFSKVKIHDNDLAAKSASSINALAYTSGNNVVFNSGQYNTNSDSGKRLLAHELTHVVQQRGKISKQSIQRQIPPGIRPCPGVVASSEYSRGNDDGNECEYETARMRVNLILDPCQCDSYVSQTMPLSVNYSATLRGKSFTGNIIPNPSGPGTIREQEGQASHIATGVVTPGRSSMPASPPQPGMSLSQDNLPPGSTPNTSRPLILTRDDNQPGGIPGDPGDTVSQQLSVGYVACNIGGATGQISLGGGYQVINYRIAADRYAVRSAAITLTETAATPPRINTPLENLTTGGTAYPAFPGRARRGGTGCTCDTVTGRQMGRGCNRGAGGAGFGRPTP